MATIPQIQDYDDDDPLIEQRKKRCKSSIPYIQTSISNFFSIPKLF